MDAFFVPNALRRAEIASQRFPAEWEPSLGENCFVYPLLPEAEQLKLRKAVQILVAEKYWEGCGGLKIDPQTQVTISAWASLLLLGWDDYYFDELKTILVYPGVYISHTPYIARSPQDPDQTATICSGEAHRKGPVVLSWWDARWDGRHARNRNVVIHEFAHKLAELGDSKNGIPPIDDERLLKQWKEVAAAEYARLRDDVAYDRPTVLDSYGATNPAEFFAVATECFFLDPKQFRRRHRRLYRCFVRFFQQDPARRLTPALPDAAERQRIQKEYLERSLAEYSAAIRRFPDAPQYYRARANVYRRLGDFEHALADFSSAIDRSAEDARAEMICDRGRFYTANGRHSEAVADFDDAIRLCPGYGRAFCERGIAHAGAGRTEQALRDLSRAISLDRKDDKAYHRRGRIYCDRGEYARALRDLTRAIRIDPRGATYYCTRARARLGMDDHQGAIADCERALRRDPALAKAYVLRAVAYDNLGDRARASADAATAARLEAQNP